MEHEFVAWLSSRLRRGPQTRVGIGDDCAVLDLGHDELLVATTDMLTDGVDFRLSEVDARRIGRKALAVNLSDLAAMGARPISALVSLALPRTSPAELARELYEGLLPLAERYNLSIDGGDTNTWDGALVIGVTALGAVSRSRGAWLRSEARAGDAILVTGQFGGSILGRHLDFEPRVATALALADCRVHAAIDVSDGLALDLWRVCQASGLGAEVRLDQVPVAAAAHELAKQLADGSTPLDHAMADGEDFELILAVPEDEADRLLALEHLGVSLTRIGRFVGERGLWQVDAAGRRPLAPSGYEHRLAADDSRGPKPRKAAP